jgi:hypothetical protein
MAREINDPQITIRSNSDLRVIPTPDAVASGARNAKRWSAGQPPNAPPWRWLDPRTVQVWLRVSGQTLVNWRARGTGPQYRIAVNGRVWYRFADVAAWLVGAEATTTQANDRIRAFLALNEEAMISNGSRLTDTLRLEYYKLAILVIDKMLPDAKIERLCELLDLTGVFGAEKLRKSQRPKQFRDMPGQYIGF